MKSDVPAELGSKLFPSFRGYLMGPKEEEAEKKSQLLAELKAVNDYLSQPGKVGVTAVGMFVEQALGAASVEHLCSAQQSAE